MGTASMRRITAARLLASLTGVTTAAVMAAIISAVVGAASSPRGHRAAGCDPRYRIRRGPAHPCGEGTEVVNGVAPFPFTAGFSLDARVPDVGMRIPHAERDARPRAQRHGHRVQDRRGARPRRDRGRVVLRKAYLRLERELAASKVWGSTRSYVTQDLYLADSVRVRRVNEAEEVTVEVVTKTPVHKVAAFGAHVTVKEAPCGGARAPAWRR